MNLLDVSSSLSASASSSSPFQTVLVSEKDVKNAKQVFTDRGVMVIPRDENSTINFHQIRNMLVNVLEEYKEKAKEKGGLGLKKENGFRELVEKDIGRYDLNLDHLLQQNQSREFSESEKAVLDIFHSVQRRIDPFLREVFGGDYQINAFGAVISSPNTPAQGWHVDSSHLFVAESESSLNVLPCHFVTVFCPLYDYEELIGPTEIALSSHKYTSILANRTVEDQYPPSEVVEKLITSPNVTRMTMQTRIGDIGIMDGRTLHRGGFNQSQMIRPLMYLSFCLPWYHEYPRSQNDGRSLF